MLDEVDWYYSLPDQLNVCAVCLADAHLIENLSLPDPDEECSFCNTFGPVFFIGDLFDEIKDAISSHGWVRALDEGSYDGREGGYQHPKDELREIAREFCEEVGINDRLLECVYESFSDEYMIDKPYGQDYYDEEFSLNWNEFKNIIKHKNRYTAFVNSSKEVSDFINTMRYFIKCNTQVLPCHQILYRGRIIKNYSDNLDMGPPPLEGTINTRMSPKGISQFYLSSDQKVVKSELEHLNSNSNDKLHIATFKLTKDIKVVNFMDVILPNPFDKLNRQYRRAMDFIKDFSVEISEPISPDREEHLEYIPTQVINEYIRSCFPDNEIHGIMYKSSKDESGYNIVFFSDKYNYLEYFSLEDRGIR